MVSLLYPLVILGIIPVIIGVIILLNLTLVRMAKEDRKEFAKNHKGIRIIMMITRSIMVILVGIAIASPFTVEEKIDSGDHSLKILVDNSSSMELFSTGIGNSIADKLTDQIPVTVIPIASGMNSPIGTEIMNNMRGNDNILLVSDGQATSGKDLEDVMVFASILNTTVNAVQLEPVHGDFAITIQGPSEALVGTPIDIFVLRKKVGNPLNCEPRLRINDKPETLAKAGEDVYTAQLSLDEGYHTLRAELQCSDDYNEVNNVFYKTIHVLPKPKILFVGESSDLKNLLDTTYEIDEVESLSGKVSSLPEYAAVILDNMHIDSIEPHVDAVTDYVLEGGGLYVIGGDNAFDRGGYEGSLFETLLPVKVGEAGFDGDLATAVVLVIDISGSTGQDFSLDSDNAKVDVEKALALEILKGIALTDKVGVVAFNEKAHTINHLDILGLAQENITTKISKLYDTGGTFVHAGLKRAEYLLEGSLGSRNIILISDGIDSIPELSLNLARTLGEKGIKVYTVGIGAATSGNTPGSAFMQTVAASTGGQYFHPEETEKLKIIFGKEEDLPEDFQPDALVILSNNHFITSGLSLAAKVTGYNLVVTKAASQRLITMGDGKPILSTWRFGLGRVVAVSTDSGASWASQLLSITNSKMWTRSLNWAIGDPEKNNDFSIKVKDTYLGEATQLTLKSDKAPVAEGMIFDQIEDELYYATVIPETIGFKTYFGAKVAVNSERENYAVGFNEDLESLVGITGGRVFDATETDELVEFIKQVSVRKKSTPTFYRAPFLLAAIAILILEIFIRRIAQARRKQ